MKTLIAFALLLAALPAYARLREDMPTCNQRYGEPQLVEGKQRTYQYFRSGLYIFVQFDDDGLAEMIGFQKKSSNMFMNEPLTETQIETLLEANLGPGYEKLPFSEAWINEETKTRAIYDEIDEFFTVITFKANNRMLREQEAAQRKALEGF